MNARLCGRRIRLQTPFQWHIAISYQHIKRQAWLFLLSKDPEPPSFTLSMNHWNINISLMTVENTHWARTLFPGTSFLFLSFLCPRRPATKVNFHHHSTSCSPEESFVKSLFNFFGVKTYLIQKSAMNIWIWCTHWFGSSLLFRCLSDISYISTADV